jgi:hypothetical protein
MQLTLAFLAMQDAASDVLGEIGDNLAPIGGVALIAVCIRLAIGAYREMAVTAANREKACADTLTAQVAATKALTDEVRTSGDGHRQQLGEIARAVQELLAHTRAGREGRG